MTEAKQKHEMKVMTARNAGEHTRDAVNAARSAGVAETQACVVIGVQNGQPFSRSFANAAMMQQYLASVPSGVEITRIIGVWTHAITPPTRAVFCGAYLPGRTKVPLLAPLRVRAILADELAYFVRLVGELNPDLRHAEQHGSIVNWLESFRQAKALFGEVPEFVRIIMWH
jgi:hypothetical protein